MSVTQHGERLSLQHSLGYGLAEEYGGRVGGTDLEGGFGPVSICCPLGYDAQDLRLAD